METEIKYKDCIIEIFRDETSESPKDWGNDSFIVSYISDCWIDDKKITKDIAIDIVENEETRKEYEKKYFIFPLEAYVHSGVWLAMGGEGNFPDRRWDVSNAGLIFISKTDAKTKKDASVVATLLINDWNNYLSGDVYGFIATDVKNNYDIDRCGGFYGSPENSGLIDEAKNSIDWYIKNEQKKAIKEKREKDINETSLSKMLISENEVIQRHALGILNELRK